MASLTKDNSLQFVLDGKRKTLRLGRVSRKQAQIIQRHVEKLLACQYDGSAPRFETSRWVESVSDQLRQRLVRVGLIEPKAADVAMPTLSELISKFKDRPRWRNLKPSSHHIYNNAFRHITNRFGANTPIDQISEGQAEDLPGYLMEAKPAGAGLAKASAYRLCDSAVMLFKFAVKSRLIDRNPFDEVKRGAIATKRRAYIAADAYQAVLRQLHGTEERLCFGLARYGGLRIPSEPKLLRWCDVDWEGQRFLVHSQKTAHHDGHESRWVPIFPELAELFDERYANAAEGDELVLPAIAAGQPSMFRQKLSFAVKRAGLKVWPRLCHSLRSTRQTELEQLWPTYVVCKWLGNSARMAERHYLQVTDEHFSRAARSAAPHAHTGGHGGTNANWLESENTSIQGCDAVCDSVENSQVDAT